MLPTHCINVLSAYHYSNGILPWLEFNSRNDSDLSKMNALSQKRPYLLVWEGNKRLSFYTRQYGMHFMLNAHVKGMPER